jgi:hypothetical protein
MKKFVIFANCQGNPLAQTLTENKEFRSRYEWLPLPPVQYLKPKDIPDVLEKVKAVDLLLYQPVSKSPNRPIELTSSFLRAHVKDSTKTISFPSMYFDGYFPHLQTLYKYVSVLNLVHDYIIAYCCSIGVSVDNTLEIINSEDLYPEEVSITLAENSIKNLSDRETEYNIEVKISKFIRENYKHKKLFNQFNHPKRAVFKYISEQILEKIGINSPYISEEGPSHLDRIMVPIYKSTHTNLRLAFNENFRIYNGLEGSGLNQTKVVQSFFDFYRKQNLKEIEKHISKTKSFVPEIIAKKYTEH